METDRKNRHYKPLSVALITKSVDARPKVPYEESEVLKVLEDLVIAVDNETYIPATPTQDNPSLSDDYIFDKEDEKSILRSLKLVNFVGKVKDIGKGSKKRKKLGFPQEYMYVFGYPCELVRRDGEINGTDKENVMIYIKINDRKIPEHVVFIVSFHKNNP